MSCVHHERWIKDGIPHRIYWTRLLCQYEWTVPFYRDDMYWRQLEAVIIQPRVAETPVTRNSPAIQLVGGNLLVDGPLFSVGIRLVFQSLSSFTDCIFSAKKWCLMKSGVMSVCMMMRKFAHDVIDSTLNFFRSFPTELLECICAAYMDLMTLFLCTKMSSLYGHYRYTAKVSISRRC